MNSDINTNVRLFDLVRVQRMELFEADLITSDEYDWLAHGCKLAKGQGSPPPRRLEDYDRIREKMDEMEKALKVVASQNLRAEMDDHTGEHADWEGGYEEIVKLARKALSLENSSLSAAGKRSASATHTRPPTRISSGLSRALAKRKPQPKPSPRPAATRSAPTT